MGYGGLEVLSLALHNTKPPNCTALYIFAGYLFFLIFEKLLMVGIP